MQNAIAKINDFLHSNVRISIAYDIARITDSRRGMKIGLLSY